MVANTSILAVHADPVNVVIRLDVVVTELVVATPGGYVAAWSSGDAKLLDLVVQSSRGNFIFPGCLKNKKCIYTTEQNY